MLLYQLIFTHIGAFFIMMCIVLLNNCIILEQPHIRANKMLKNYVYYMILLNICYVFNLDIKIQLAIVLFDLYCNLPNNCFWWRVN